MKNFEEMNFEEFMEFVKKERRKLTLEVLNIAREMKISKQDYLTVFSNAAALFAIVECKINKEEFIKIINDTFDNGVKAKEITDNKIERKSIT